MTIVGTRLHGRCIPLLDIDMRHSNEEKDDDIMKLLGLPPYDGPSNVCRNDPHYARWLEEKYGKDVDKLIKEFSKRTFPPFT